MSRNSFGEIARANFGLMKVVAILTRHFEHEVPGGFRVASAWFIDRYVVEVNVHIHKDHDAAPASTDWTNRLCFLPSMDVRGVNTDVHRITEEENNPIAVFKGIIKHSEKGSSFHFQNIFVVRRTESDSYYINIHKYPRTFFHLIITEDPELLGLVVRNQIKINGVQLELPREAHLSDFID